MPNFNKLLVKYKHFYYLQKHVQNQQHINDVSFYEFLFQKLTINIIINFLAIFLVSKFLGMILAVYFFLVIYNFYLVIFGKTTFS